MASPKYFILLIFKKNLNQLIQKGGSLVWRSGSVEEYSLSTLSQAGPWKRKVNLKFLLQVPFLSLRGWAPNFPKLSYPT
jgi:hypothetical protein